jgi:hypothetical protein
VESLNPLVTVETLDSYSVLSDGEIDGILRSVDLVCVTDSSRAELVCSFFTAPANAGDAGGTNERVC